MQAALVSGVSPDELRQLRTDYPSIEWMDLAGDRDRLQTLGPDVAVVYGNVRPFELEKLPGLKWIHTTWTGVENVLKVTAGRPEIILTNTRGQVSRSITEHVVGSVYYLARNMGRFYEASMNGEWCRGPEIGFVQGAHALVIGLGALGRPICRALTENKMTVSGVNTSGKPVDGCDDVYTKYTCRGILPTVDYIICCLPATAGTDDMVDAAFLADCKDGVKVINVGRGNAVNQDDLLAAIDSGKAGGAVLDTTTPEPLPEDSPLYHNPKILITAHRSWMPMGPDNVAFTKFLLNLEPFMKGETEKMPDRVDRKKGY